MSSRTRSEAAKLGWERRRKRISEWYRRERAELRAEFEAEKEKKNLPSEAPSE